MTFHDSRSVSFTVCPVTVCDWRTSTPIHDGGMDQLDDHMVAMHPASEWARRVVERRWAKRVRKNEGLTR